MNREMGEVGVVWRFTTTLLLEWSFRAPSLAFEWSICSLFSSAVFSDASLPCTSLNGFIRNGAVLLSCHTPLLRFGTLTRVCISVGHLLLLPVFFLSYRFKDGSIVEAVVWKGKGAQRHRVVEQVG